MTGWRPLFCMMEKGLQNANVSIPNDVAAITEAVIAQTYKVGMDYIKSVASYIWEKRREGTIIEAHSIGYWCKMIGAATVKRRGTELDKRKLESDKRDGGRAKRIKYTSK